MYDYALPLLEYAYAYNIILYNLTCYYNYDMCIYVYIGIHIYVYIYIYISITVYWLV